MWVLEKKTPIAYGGYSAALGLPHLADMYIYVMPGHRRRRYGTRLLRYILAHVSEPRITTLSSPVDNMRTPAALFLEYHQFEVEHVEVELICDLTQTVFSADSNFTVSSSEHAADQMRRLYDDSFGHYPWYQPYADADEVLDDLGRGGEVLLWTHAGQLVGFAGLRYVGSVADIEPLGIVKDAQGQGFGRKLLSTTLAYLQQAGCDAVQLAVWENNIVAVRLYKGFGFRPKSKRMFMALKFRS